MVKNGMSLVLVAVLLGQASASGWLWRATPAEQEPTQAIEQKAVEETPTVQAEVSQAHVNEMFLQSMIIVPSNTEEPKAEPTKVEESKKEETPITTTSVADVGAAEADPAASWGIFGWLGYGTQPASQSTVAVGTPTPTYETKESIAAGFHLVSTSSSSSVMSEPTAVITEEPKTEVKEEAKPAEKPVDVNVDVEVKATPTEPASSGWSFFRLWSSPAPVVAETPKVEEPSLETAVAVAAAEQPAETVEAAKEPTEAPKPRSKTLRSKTSKSMKREAANEAASRPYRFRSPKAQLPHPMVHVNTKMVHCPKTATMSSIKQMFDSLARDKNYARYQVVGIPADLMQHDRIVEMANAYGFQVLDKKKRSIYVQRNRRGTKLVSKLLVDELVREDARRNQAELQAKATPNPTVVARDVIEELDFDAVPSIPQTITTDIDPLQYGRESYPSKNVPHRHKSVLRRKRTIIPAKGKSSVTSSGVNKRSAVTAKLTNGKRALNEAEIKGAIREAQDLLNISSEKLTSSEESFDENMFNFRGPTRNQRINKAAFPPLTAEEQESPIFDMNKFFAHDYFGFSTTEDVSFDIIELFNPAPAKADDEPIFDMNKFFSRDRFAALPEPEPFSMDELFYPAQPKQQAQSVQQPVVRPAQPARVNPNGHGAALSKNISGSNKYRGAGRGRGRAKWVPKNGQK